MVSRAESAAERPAVYCFCVVASTISLCSPLSVVSPSICKLGPSPAVTAIAACRLCMFKHMFSWHRCVSLTGLLLLPVLPAVETSGVVVMCCVQLHSKKGLCIMCACLVPPPAASPQVAAWFGLLQPSVAEKGVGKLCSICCMLYKNASCYVMLCGDSCVV